MNQIEVLGVQHAKEIYKIISEYQKQLQNKAQLNWNLESISDVLRSDKAIGLVQYIEGVACSELLAFIIYRDLINIAEILLLGTNYERQSQGLMKTLFCDIKDKYPEIWLEVHEMNTKARFFYENESFKLDGVRPKYYTDSKSALIMSWKRDLAI